MCCRAFACFDQSATSLPLRTGCARYVAPATACAGASSATPFIRRYAAVREATLSATLDQFGQLDGAVARPTRA